MVATMVTVRSRWFGLQQRAVSTLMFLRRIAHRDAGLAFAEIAVHGVGVRHLPALILCGVPGLVLVALDRPRLAWALWFTWLGASLWAPAPWGWLVWLGCLVINTAGLLSIRSDRMESRRETRIPGAGRFAACRDPEV